ncbi:MAG: hypothetical protein JWS10_4176 [Cypionkella sp.]|nr:hypothetical protein [Cypionkella sp.]
MKGGLAIRRLRALRDRFTEAIEGKTPGLLAQCAPDLRNTCRCPRRHANCRRQAPRSQRHYRDSAILLLTVLSFVRGSPIQDLL